MTANHDRNDRQSTKLDQILAELETQNRELEEAYRALREAPDALGYLPERSLRELEEAAELALASASWKPQRSYLGTRC